MKTKEEFLNDIYKKAERLRAEEAAAAALRKKRRKIFTLVTAAAACVMLAVGVSGMTELFATYDGALEGDSIDAVYETANGASETVQRDSLQDYDSASAANENGTAEGTEHKSVYDESADLDAAAASSDGTIKKSKAEGSTGGTTDTNPQGSGSNSSSDTSEKSRIGKSDDKNENIGNEQDSAADNIGRGDNNNSGNNNDSAVSYFCLPARIIIEDADGNAEAAYGDAIPAVFDEVMKLESEGKAVSARFAEPAPVSHYVKKVIYVTHGNAVSEGEAVRLDDEHPDNIVWYITE